MKKQLRLEIKQNLRKPPRVYVKSTDLKTIYGSFHVDETGGFDGWEKLTPEQTVELKQFIQNVTAVYSYLKPSLAHSLADFRFRLPMEFIDTLEQLEMLCHQENVDINIFDAIIPSIIQQMKIATSKLTDTAKIKALALLDKAHIADFKKQDHSDQIKAVFSEFQAIYNRSEKLHQNALKLFNKDKSYSPRAIQGMAQGETLPSKWLVACAIDLLIDEKKEILISMLSSDDLFMLWAKPLMTANCKKEVILEKAKILESVDLIERIEKGIVSQSETNMSNIKSNE
jgi:hypothetical protein